MFAVPCFLPAVPETHDCAAGHYFIYMDKVFGSLVTPMEYEAATAKGKALTAN